MDEKLKKMVEDAVTGIFANKEDADKRQKTIDALQASAEEIKSLQEQLATANKAVESASQEIETVKAEVVVLNETIAATKSEEDIEAEKASALKEVVEAKEAVDVELEKVALELSTIKKEITAKERMAELTTAGIVREDVDAQKAKVVEMDDEAFAAYRDELVEVKEQVIASLKKSIQTEAAAADEANPTPPANIDLNKTEQAALNLESPSSTMAEDYAKLGKALAANMIKQ